MIVHVFNKWLLLLCCIVLLTSCIKHSSPEVVYYSLLTMEQLEEVQPISSHPEINLGIGPITIPDRLKRSQIATRQHDNQYAFDEFNRWAGVLEKNLTEVIGDNLGVLLGVEKIGFFPWMNHFKPTYRVVIDIQRLNGSLAGEAELSAHWAVADADGRELIAGGKISSRESFQESGFPALIRAESLLIADLSKKIAIEINGLIMLR